MVIWQQCLKQWIIWWQTILMLLWGTKQHIVTLKSAAVVAYNQVWKSMSPPKLHIILIGHNCVTVYRCVICSILAIPRVVFNYIHYDWNLIKSLKSVKISWNQWNLVKSVKCFWSQGKFYRLRSLYTLFGELVNPCLKHNMLILIVTRNIRRYNRWCLYKPNLHEVLKPFGAN